MFTSVLSIFFFQKFIIDYETTLVFTGEAKWGFSDFRGFRPCLMKKIRYGDWM